MEKWLILGLRREMYRMSLESKNCHSPEEPKETGRLDVMWGLAGILGQEKDIGGKGRTFE